jgi:ureidoacrylate peracid hydrolase
MMVTHPYIIPPSIKDRVIRRQGKFASHDTIDAGRTALVVVDMQNYFVAKGFPLEVPVARDIVPNINKLARALRAAGAPSYGCRPARRWRSNTGPAITPTC